MTVRVIIPEEVLKELQIIGDYIEEQGSQQAALQFVRSLRARCESLVTLPHRGSNCGKNRRRLFENPNQIIYRVEEVESDVIIYIVTIHHMSRSDSNLS